MKAHEIATEAARLVSGDRQRTHGDKAANFANIARLWTAYLTNRAEANPNNDLNDLSPLDVAHMMVLLKVARTQLGAVNPDDWTDMAGYAACAGEVALS